MTTHDRYRELVAGHALSALEPEDEQLVLAHLSACAPCSRELVAARETAAQFAYAAGQVDPPAGLFAAIKAEVLSSDPDAFDLPQAAAPAKDDGVVVPLARKRRFETRAAKLVLAAASISIATVAGLGAWNVSLQHDNSQSVQASEAFQRAIGALTAEPGQTVQLKNADGAIRAVAIMHGSSMDLVTRGLATNDAKTSQYVLWGQNGVQAPTYLGAFNIDDDTVDTVRGIQTATLTEKPDMLLISKETGQAGKVVPQQPTTPTYAQGQTA